MFKLEKQDCKISSVNPRNEKHGDGGVLAIDVKVETKLPNTALEMFNPDLRKTFFVKGDPGDADLADQGMAQDHLPILRFPECKKIAWSWKGEGYRVIIPQGISGDEDLIFIDAGLDKFNFQFINGGVIGVSFNIIVHPSEKEGGTLLKLLESNIDLTLEPPSAEERAQMEIDAAA